MGEMADYEIDRMIFGPLGKYDSPERSDHRRRNFQQGVGRFKWRRADGEIIDMHDMEDEYIANCIRLCDEKGNTGKKDDFESILKARQSVYLDQARKAPAATVTTAEPQKKIGSSTTWEVPKWVFVK